MGTPGDILNDVKFKQAILFKGINEDEDDKKIGTDIDWMYEDGKLWVVAEIKEYGKELPTGQRILLERFCNNLANYKTFILLAWHKAPPNEDIDLKDCIVSKIYYKGIYKNKWKNVIGLKGKELTVKEAFSSFKIKYGKK